MNNYVQCQNCKYYISASCAYYEQPLDHYPDENITCTDYAPKQDYCEQINNITVPMSQVPKEIKQQWIQDYDEQPKVQCIELYEKFDDGTEICHGFSALCKHHGDCAHCPKLIDYNNSCNE